MKVVDHTVSLLFSFCISLEHLQLLSCVYQLSIVVVDGRSIQQFAVHFVAVITQPDNYWVGVENGLDVLCLSCVNVGLLDGEQNEIVPVIPLEPQGNSVGVGAVTPFV